MPEKSTDQTERERPEFVITGKVGHSSVVPGSDIAECSECHHPVWCSPSTQALQKELGPIPYLCMECAGPRLKAAPPDEICPMNNGQLREIANYFGISMAEASMRLKELMQHLPELLD